MRVVRKVLSGIIVAAGLCVAAAMLLPAAFGYHRYVITGSSMQGTYDRGSIVFDKPVPVSALEVGDVITYTPPADTGVRGLITHRIVSIHDGKRGESFRTKGDANEKADPWRFELSQPTQARVDFSIPYLGFGIAALSMLPVRMLIIGLPALLIAVALLARLWRQAGEEASAQRQAAAGQQPAGTPPLAQVPTSPSPSSPGAS
jgi:signal peptidase I